MQSVRRRLFFAAFPDEIVREQLVSLADQNQQSRSRPHHPLDLHMTLTYLGLQDASSVACIKSIGEQIETLAFNLTLQRLGYWKGPRILIAEPGHTPDELSRLVDSLWQGSQQCGVRREVRPYRPHVTLQRKASEITQRQVEPVCWHVDHFSLVESLGDGTGPRYQRLETWSLGNGEKKN